MLKKLILENWKSFRYAELPIDPLTILIGANASGKSNAVEALSFLSQFASGSSLTQIAASHNGVRGGEQWLARKGIDSFTLKLILGVAQGEATDLIYSVTVLTFPELRVKEESLRVCIDGSSIEEIVFQTRLVDSLQTDSSFFPDRMEIFVNDESLGGEVFHPPSTSILGLLPFMLADTDSQNLLSWVKSTVALLQGVKHFCPAPSGMRGYSSISKYLSLDASNIAGFLASLEASFKSEVEDSISSCVSKLVTQDVKRIWSEKVGRSSADAMLYGEEQWGNSESPVEIDAKSMSDGTLRFIAILTALLTYPQSSQLVIEDIDDGFHPSRTSLLLQALRDIGEQRNIDVLVTTHNPALLDSLEQDFLPFVVIAHRDSHTGESLLTPLDKIENLPKLLASASLGDLATQGALERNLETEAIAP